MITNTYPQLVFNHQPSTIMHIDLNSCFATIEQQANPLLRGKPIAVAAYTTPNGFILAPSVEAKHLGVKMGMQVREGKRVCPGLIILSPDPWKYRNIHLKLKKLISNYTCDFHPRSIDEFVLNLDGYLSLVADRRSVGTYDPEGNIQQIAREIKTRIKLEIGEWLTVSIGIAPNRYLAKVASNLKKPDGLNEINKDNFLNIYQKLELTDLPYIKFRNASRLNSVGIGSVIDFYEAALWKLKIAFKSINGFYWYMRLRGYEVDEVAWGRRSYGNSTAIGKKVDNFKEASPIVARLTEKMTGRLRSAGFKARGIHLSVVFKDGTYWHEGRLVGHELYDVRDFLKSLLRLLMKSGINKPVVNIAVSAFSLVKNGSFQLNFFSNVSKSEALTKATDTVNKKWGDFSLMLGRSLNSKIKVMDRIAFGGIKELEEFTLS